MRKPRSMAAIGFATLALAATGLAACSSPEPGDDNQSPQVTESAEESAAEEADETDATEDPTQENAGSDLTQENFLERTTNAMLAKGSYHQVITVESEGQTVTFEGDIFQTTDPDEMVMHLVIPVDDAGGLATMLVIDGMAYMQIPDVTGEMWIALDGSVPGLGSAEDFVGQSDLAAQVENMNAAILEFDAEPNSETIDGVVTTKLTLLLDAEKFLGEEPDPEVGDTIAAVYFVGPDDLPRRITMDIGEGATIMDMTRWGEPLDVTAPSADQIIDMSELMQEP